MARGRYHRARVLLGKSGTPDDLLSDFDKKSRYYEKFAADNAPTASEHFTMTCRKFDFIAPFENDSKRRAFRPCLRDTKDPKYIVDISPNPDDAASAAIEQGYRRGFVQGFAEARRLAEKSRSLKEIKQFETILQRWRTAPVQIIGSLPGSDESMDLGLDERIGIGSKLRYSILKRDGFRCQDCGASAREDITLEVDHKISVFDGGDNSESNLRALCSRCNRGKGSASI